MTLVAGDDRPLRLPRSELLLPTPRCAVCPEPATSMCDGTWYCLEDYNKVHHRDPTSGNLIHPIGSRAR